MSSVDIYRITYQNADIHFMKLLNIDFKFLFWLCNWFSAHETGSLSKSTVPFVRQEMLVAINWISITVLLGPFWSILQH